MSECRGHQTGRGPPFPGMDPYLEGELWQEFHDTFAHQIRGQLLPLLPPAVKEMAAPSYTVVAPPVVELVNLFPLEVPLLSVEIRDVAERRLVTVIEILSPVNKRGKGFQEYVERRTELLQTQTHLLEIDLLRDGRRLQLTGGELPPASYYIFLSRFTRRPRTEVWTIGLRELLPTVPVPLLPPDPDVPLQLQAAVEACFGLVGYERLLDYTQPPPPPALDADELAWVRARVEAWETGGVNEV